MIPVNTNTLNRGISSDSNMLKSVADYESSTNTKVAVGVLSVITLGGALGIYALYSYLHGNEKQKIFAEIASAIAHTSAEEIASGRLEIQFDFGTIIAEQMLENEQKKVKITFGNESTFLTNVPDLRALQDRIILDMVTNHAAYFDMGMPYQPSKIRLAIPLHFDQINKRNILSEEPAKGGNLSEVTKITYQNSAVYFFKPINSTNEYLTAALVSGIPGEKSHYAERSMFAYVMSEILDLHVVPKTGLSENSAGVKGYIQEKAPGLPGQKCLKTLSAQGRLESLKSNPHIIRQMVECQLLDALTGQVDRHMNNYFIDITTNKVSCIDNDASGGFLVTHPNSMIPSRRSDGYLSHRLTEQEEKVVNYLELYNVASPADVLKKHPDMGWSVFLPPVIDSVMADKFKNLNYAQLLSYMSHFNFNSQEMSAACNRLKAIQLHIEVLEKRQAAGVLSIISPEDWALPETIDRLFPFGGKNAGNALSTFTTYLSRDMAEFSGNAQHYEAPPWHGDL